MSGPEAMAPTQPSSARRLLLWVESLAILVLGIVVMAYFYQCAARADGEIGAPGHDSFYHVKMAAMIPEHGLLGEFPWLQHVYFRQQGEAFVSHHYGFHFLLLPFVQVAQGTTGDGLVGGRWAICTFFGLNLVLFNLLLRTGRVPCRWAWLLLFLLLPDQFFTRHLFIRAIGASLIFIQLLLLLIFQRRYAWAGLVVVGYIHLYLGAVMFAPLLVALCAFARIFGPKTEREWPWRMVAWTTAGWLIGVVTYPYAGGMLEFLKLQVLGSGLSPDIEVGREWKPYTDPWWFAQMASTVLVVWVAALCLRLRMGPPLNARTLAVTLIQFAFLALTLKARRFIEYWPPMCLLSAAYLAGPVLETTIAGWRARWAALRGPATWRDHALPAVGLAAASALMVFAVRPAHVQGLLADWSAWSAVIALLLLAPLVQAWGPATRRPWLRTMGVPVTALLVVGVITIVVRVSWNDPGAAAKFAGTTGLWLLVVASYLTIPLFVSGATPAAQAVAVAWPRATRIAMVGTSAFVLLSGVLYLGATRLQSVGRQITCNYDLAEVRSMMAFLEHNSAAGDVVFTDDWDIFPVYFYHNTHNHYIVGLDPKFTHERRPDLWERYVRITRAEVPTRSTVRFAATDGGAPRRASIDIDVRDIRDEFGARWVIVDRDHRSFAALLTRSPDVAELVYPGRDYAQCRDAAYLVFRVRGADEPVPGITPPPPDANGHLYLTQLRPAAAEQGWGTLRTNASVEGRRMMMRGELYRQGLGTHAPSRLLYEIPAGYAHFEAEVGVDDGAGGEGSVVAAVSLDGAQVFCSPVLTGLDAPARVRIPLAGAQQLLLTAETTSDGDRFDHVNWANARFVRADAAKTAADVGLARDELLARIAEGSEP